MPDVVTQLRGAGFSDQEVSDYMTAQRSQLSAAGFNDNEINNYFGVPNDPAGVPPALIQRAQQGADVAKALTSLPGETPMQGAVKAFSGHAIVVDPAEIALTNPGNLSVPQRFFYLPEVLAGQFYRSLRDTIRDFHTAATGQATPEEEVETATNTAMMAVGGSEFPKAIETSVAASTKPIMRMEVGPGGEPQMTEIGMLPKGQDFTDAGNAISNGNTTPDIEAKLRKLYEELGHPPAEVAADARNDPVVAQSLLSSDKNEIPGITAYHGSPYDFEAFDINKVGTGEGAQSYGHGLYFAENKSVAESYLPSPADAFPSADNTLPIRTQNLYQVRINHDPADFLDWDKRLNEQTPEIQAALQKVMGEQKWEEFKGSQASTALRNGFIAFRDETVAKNLSEAGIPGIKYFDQQSRPTYNFGDRTPRGNTRNYVVFDDKSVDIVSKNGEAVPNRIRDQVLERARGGEEGDILTERLPASVGSAAREMPTYSDAEKQILSKISVDEAAPRTKLTWSTLYTNFIDKLYPISKAVKEADLGDLTTENNPYQLARLLSGHVGKADHFLNNGTFDFKTYENNGPSLKEILAPISDDLNGFRAYATAARALELEGRGIKSGFDTGEASAPPLMSSGLDAARTVVVQGRGKYEMPFRGLIAYQNRVSQYLRDSGVLSDAGYKAMIEANKMYVPFSRVMGLDPDARAVGGSSLQARNPIKAIKGSARDIIDPIESIVRNTYHFIEMAERNQIGTKLVDMLHGMADSFPDHPPAAEAIEGPKAEAAEPIAESLGELGIKKSDELADALAHAATPDREGQISVLRDGKRQTFAVDPELARAMKGLDAQSTGMLERALSFPASTLRAGAVSTPDFWGRHILRDFIYAATTFKGGVFHPIDMARGMAGLIMKDKDYWDWLKGGGGNIASVGVDRRYLQTDLRKLTGQTGLVGRAWNVLADPQADMWQKTAAVGTLPFKAIGKFVLDPLRAATQFAENVSHLAAFKKTMRAAPEEPATSLREQIMRAAWASRDTAVDAARMGANMRAYNLITAFSNIKLQDTDRMVRAVKDNPISALVKMSAAITVPSVALWAANHNDPRYAEIPQWEKDMFWLVMTPDHVFRIPKPWAMGMIFGTLPERLLDQYEAHKLGAFKDYFHQLWETSGPDFVPTAAAPIIDQFANRSTFTNRTLIPSSQEKFLPEYQYTPYTTELAKKIGKIIGAFPGIRDAKTDQSALGGPARALSSPILMENYIRGWTGTLGVYALQAADAALRKQGILPDPPQPASTLADIPFVRAFVVRYPSASAESVQNFYDQYERTKTYYSTWIAKARDGDAGAMQHIQDMGGPGMFLQLDNIAKVLSEHQKVVQDVYKNPQIKPDEKRQLIDQLYYSMIQVARHGNEVIRQATPGAVPTPLQ